VIPSDAFSPEFARNWSAASQNLFCNSPRSVATRTPSRTLLYASKPNWALLETLTPT